MLHTVVIHLKFEESEQSTEHGGKAHVDEEVHASSSYRKADSRRSYVQRGQDSVELCYHFDPPAGADERVRVDVPSDGDRSKKFEVQNCRREDHQGCTDARGDYVKADRIGRLSRLYVRQSLWNFPAKHLFKRRMISRLGSASPQVLVKPHAGGER